MIRFVDILIFFSVAMVVAAILEGVQRQILLRNVY
jgi:hypothetical protein